MRGIEKTENDMATMRLGKRKRSRGKGVGQGTGRIKGGSPKNRRPSEARRGHRLDPKGSKANGGSGKERHQCSTALHHCTPYQAASSPSRDTDIGAFSSPLRAERASRNDPASQRSPVEARWRPCRSAGAGTQRVDLS